MELPWVKRFGPSTAATGVTTLGVWSRRLLRPLLTSASISHAVAGVVAHCRTSRQTSRGKLCVPGWRPCRIYRLASERVLGISIRCSIARTMAALYPVPVRQVSNSRHGAKPPSLPSDSASRPTPLLRRMVPLVTAHRGLPPPNLTFALPPRFQIFSAGFQGCSLPSVVRSRHKRVVETYPLEPPTADLR